MKIKTLNADLIHCSPLVLATVKVVSITSIAGRLESCHSKMVFLTFGSGLMHRTISPIDPFAAYIISDVSGGRK